MSKARKTLSAIAVVTAWTLVVSASAWADDCGPINSPVSGLGEAEMESSIGCLINQQRTEYGLQPVTNNSDLHRAAMSHSNEMIDTGYFGHTSPDGMTFIDRIESTGYMRGARTWIVGENLVWGTGELSSPQALVTAWMNSPPHRENLLRPSFREIGIAAIAGTPVSESDHTGVTVSSEYGYRTFGKAKPRRKKARKSKAHKRHTQHQASTWATGR